LAGYLRALPHVFLVGNSSSPDVEF
jgi:hypothetical protein